jgi:Protein of unknown function (DUF3592)
MFTLFGLVLTAVGVALILRGQSARRKATQSLMWPSTDGVVLTSGVEGSEFRSDDDFGTVRKYTPAVTYSFWIGSSERHGTQIAVGMSNLYSELAQAEQHARRYPVGRRVRVFYDPEGTESVLEPGDSRSANTILGIGLGIALTGGLLVLISFKVD